MAIYFPRCYASLSVLFDDFGSDDVTNPQIVNLPLRSASVHLNNYKEADTFGIDFDARELPFLPGLIRNAGVQIWLFQTDTYTVNASSYARPENIVIAGLVDRPSMRLASDGKTFHMEGRDYTALLIGKAWDPRRKIPVGGSLVDTVQRLVDEATGAAGTGRVLTVVFVGEQLDDAPPRLGVQSATVVHGTVTTKPPTVGEGRGKSKKRGISVDHADSTYWDVIYRLCLHHGFVCYVKLDKVIISTPQTLDANAEEPILRVAYGRNLESLEIDRSMGKEAVPQVIAASYDPKSRTTIEARWPDDKSKNVFANRAKISTKSGKISGIGTKKDEELRVDAPFGITDMKLLQAFARNYYSTLARGESKVRLRTKHLRDLGNLDLLRARTGKPIAIGFDPFNKEDLRVLSQDERFARLVGMGYEREIAQLVASEFDKIRQFETPCRTREITFEYDNDQGISVEIEANQYVFVERDDR